MKFKFIGRQSGNVFVSISLKTKRQRKSFMKHHHHHYPQLDGSLRSVQALKEWFWLIVEIIEWYTGVSCQWNCVWEGKSSSDLIDYRLLIFVGAIKINCQIIQSKKLKIFKAKGNGGKMENDNSLKWCGFKFHGTALGVRNKWLEDFLSFALENVRWKCERGVVTRQLFLISSQLINFHYDGKMFVVSLETYRIIVDKKL